MRDYIYYCSRGCSGLSVCFPRSVHCFAINVGEVALWYSKLFDIVRTGIYRLGYISRELPKIRDSNEIENSLHTSQDEEHRHKRSRCSLRHFWVIAAIQGILYNGGSCRKTETFSSHRRVYMESHSRVNVLAGLPLPYIARAVAAARYHELGMQGRTWGVALRARILVDKVR